jgi:integrase
LDVQYRVGTKQRRISLDAAKFTAEQARKVAKDYLAQVQLGRDPSAERDKAREAASAITLTVGDLADKYLNAQKGVFRPSTFEGTERYFNQHLAPLRSRPVDGIKRVEVANCLHSIKQERGATAAARARSTLSAMFAWSMREGLCEANPVIGTNDPDPQTSRDRVLSDAELAAIWNNCGDDDFGRAVKLLMLTGCRRDEIGSLRWSEIDLDAGTLTIPAERSKNGKAHTLTLPPMAVDILRAIPRRENRDYVFGTRGGGFSRWSAHTAALRQRLGEMKPWWLHDLRRSCATGMAEIGIQPHIIEAVLNHISGHKGGIAGIYNRAAYAEPMRVALQRWADHVAALLDGRAGRKVVPIRRA